MKVSIRQLEAVVSKMRQEAIGYRSWDDKSMDASVEICIVEEDVASGVMTSTFNLVTEKQEEGNAGTTTISVEIYPYDDKELPAMDKHQRTKIKP